MTKRKTPTAVDPHQSARDALAATVAMGKLLPADEGDPAHQPVKDWSTIKAEWCSVDDVLDYIAAHGRSGIPQDLIDKVFSRAYAFDVSELDNESPDASTDTLTRDRAIIVNDVAGMLADATSRSQAAEILKPLPSDIATDSIWRAIQNDHEKMTAHGVSTMRLRDHAEMLRSVASSGGSHLDADIPY